MTKQFLVLPEWLQPGVAYWICEHGNGPKPHRCPHCDFTDADRGRAASVEPKGVIQAAHMEPKAMNLSKTVTEWIAWLMEPGGRGIEEDECRELAALLRAYHEPPADLVREHLRDVRELLELARRYVPEDRKLFSDINAWLQITELPENRTAEPK